MVEQKPEELRVGGSIPSSGTIFLPKFLIFPDASC